MSQSYLRGLIDSFYDYLIHLIQSDEVSSEVQVLRMSHGTNTRS